jgi:hypothetical protein
VVALSVSFFVCLLSCIGWFFGRKRRAQRRILLQQQQQGIVYQYQTATTTQQMPLPNQPMGYAGNTNFGFQGVNQGAYPVYKPENQPPPSYNSSVDNSNKF